MSDKEEEAKGEDLQIDNRNDIEKSTIKTNVKGLEEYISKHKMKNKSKGMKRKENKK